MSQMHLAMYIIFALQLALLSIWIPQRCQNLLQPWRLPGTVAGKQRRLLSGLNFLLLGVGVGNLLLGLSGWLTSPMTLMFVFTALQVWLLAIMRHWLPKQQATLTKRRASLQRRRVLDFVTPAQRLLAMLGLIGVPALLWILYNSGLWTKNPAQLWLLFVVGVVAQGCLAIAIYRAVFRHRPASSEHATEQQVALQQGIQRNVSTYLSALHILNLMLVLLLLLGVFGIQPELLFIGISLLLQLLLAQSSAEKGVAAN